MKTEGSKTFIEVVSIASERDFSRRLGVSVKAKYALFSAGASSVSETTFNSYSTYLAVVAHVDDRTQQVVGPKLTAEARALATTNPGQFRQRCGSHFVRSQTLGGEYAALVEVFSSTEAEKSEVQLQASGSVKIFNTSAEATDKLSAALKNRRYVVKLIRKGTSGAVAKDSDSILGDALTFPTALKPLPDGDLFSARVDVQDYLTLDVPASLRDSAAMSDTDSALRLERYDGMAQQRRAHLADIQYVIGNPTQFHQGFSVKALEAQKQILDGVLFDMKSAIARCLDPAMRRCSDKDFVAPPQDYKVALPDRLPGPTREELLAQAAALQARIDRASAAFDLVVGNVASGEMLTLTCGGVPNLPQTNGICVLKEIRARCQQAGCKP